MTKALEGAAATVGRQRSARAGVRSKGGQASQEAAFRAAREEIARAAEALGGHERIAEWAREDAKNESVFWASIYPKLIPIQLSGDGAGAVEHGVIVRFV